MVFTDLRHQLKAFVAGRWWHRYTLLPGNVAHDHAKKRASSLIDTNRRVYRLIFLTIACIALIAFSTMFMYVEYVVGVQHKIAHLMLTAIFYLGVIFQHKNAMAPLLTVIAEHCFHSYGVNTLLHSLSHPKSHQTLPRVVRSLSRRCSPGTVLVTPQNTSL